MNFYGFHVGEYASPMDPMGYGNFSFHLMENNPAFLPAPWFEGVSEEK